MIARPIVLPNPVRGRAPAAYNRAMFGAASPARRPRGGRSTVACLALLSVGAASARTQDTAHDDPGDAGHPAAAPNDRSRARTERMARDRTALRASLEGMLASGLYQRLVDPLEKLLAEERGRWIKGPDWGQSVAEVRWFLDWNSPAEGTDPRPGDGMVETLAGYAALLEGRGIELIVVPVPRRIQIYPDRLPGVPELEEDFAGIDPRYASLMVDLSEAGVEVVDLLPSFASQRFSDAPDDDRQLFHDWDTHWTPRGAELAADRIAARLLELDGFDRGPAREGEDFVVVREQGMFAPATKVPAEGEEPDPVWYRRVLDPAGEPAHSPDRDSPFLVMGDSLVRHAAGEASDVVSLLYAKTGQRFDTIIHPGSPPAKVWDSIRRRRDALAGKRVVVWIFSAKTLATPGFEVSPIGR